MEIIKAAVCVKLWIALTCCLGSEGPWRVDTSLTAASETSQPFKQPNVSKGVYSCLQLSVIIPGCFLSCVL